jgi:hypothetical protein
MDQAHWLMREQESIAHARAATFPDVRLIHYDLARRYSAKAAEAAANGSVSAPAKLKGNLRAQLMTAFNGSHPNAG